MGTPREFFDSKAGKLLHRTLGWPAGPAGVKASVQQPGQQSGPEGGSTGGNSSGLTGGLTGGAQSGLGTATQGGSSPGNVAVAQPGSTTVAHPEPESMVQGGVHFGVELHVVDGRLIVCRPGERPPLSLRQHTEAFLEWLRDHPMVPGNEVPVSTMEHVLYWDFLCDTGLPMKSWRAVGDVLMKLRGGEKYQADWRNPAGEGPTPMVFKIRKRRRAKVVQLAQRREAS